MIIDWLVKEFKSETGVDLSADKMAMQRLKDAAEKAKKDLSGVTSVQISLPFISMNATGPLHLEKTLSRAQFDAMTAPLVERTMGPVRQALKDAKMTANDLDQVLLVGGSTRIPAVVEQIVGNAFGWHQAVGGGIGTALMQGIKRGLFSNEAGMGSAPNAAATAHVTHPAKQGFIQALGVFTDTLAYLFLYSFYHFVR